VRSLPCSGRRCRRRRLRLWPAVAAQASPPGWAKSRPGRPIPTADPDTAQRSRSSVRRSRTAHGRSGTLSCSGRDRDSFSGRPARRSRIARFGSWPGQHAMTRRPPAEGSAHGGVAAGRRCDASEWVLALGCTRGDGTIVCPSCDEVVESRPHDLLGRRVCVIAAHPPGPSLPRAGAQ
jgi:hypothetical protein